MAHRLWQLRTVMMVHPLATETTEPDLRFLVLKPDHDCICNSRNSINLSFGVSSLHGRVHVARVEAAGLAFGVFLCIPARDHGDNNCQARGNSHGKQERRECVFPQQPPTSPACQPGLLLAPPIRAVGSLRWQ